MKLKCSEVLPAQLCLPVSPVSEYLFFFSSEVSKLARCQSASLWALEQDGVILPVAAAAAAGKCCWRSKCTAVGALS